MKMVLWMAVFLFRSGLRHPGKTTGTAAQVSQEVRGVELVLRGSIISTIRMAAPAARRKKPSNIRTSPSRPARRILVPACSRNNAASGPAAGGIAPVEATHSSALGR